jgi:hypothetical protein
MFWKISRRNLFQEDSNRIYNERGRKSGEKGRTPYQLVSLFPI